MKNQYKYFLSLTFILLTNHIAFCRSEKIFITEGERKIEALPSTYEPLKELGNVHSLTPDGRIIRGAMPSGRTIKLKENGITDVLILRAPSKDEVESETKELLGLGYSPQQVHLVPLDWKVEGQFQKQCEQIIQALEIMKSVREERSRKLYLHCTMGEDRTGGLAVLYRMIFDKWDQTTAIEHEACDKGYGSASPTKPKDVVDRVAKNLSSTFARMFYLVEQGQLSFAALNPSVCTTDPWAGLTEKVKNKKVERLACSKIKRLKLK